MYQIIIDNIYLGYFLKSSKMFKIKPTFSFIKPLTKRIALFRQHKYLSNLEELSS